MRYNRHGVAYYYTWLNDHQSSRPTLLCLHGFTGTSETFRQIAEEIPEYNLLAIDLIGHGQTESLVHPYRYQLTSLIQDLKGLMDHLNLTSFALLGYSMGARVALSFALTYPESITHLILESGSPGLSTDVARQQRRNSDLKLAQKLLNSPIAEFVKCWEQLPLFASQKRLGHTIQLKIKNERLHQSAFGLATSLWGMGTGSQPNYWPQLSDLNKMPLLLITGSEDPKFQEIAGKMVALQPSITSQTIELAGHAVHLEQPQLFASSLKQWLKGETLNETH
ncbi:2-succinyl-6-hydroxy-2,4-cyclohexadiene-1-carboxylate synthase [uncultured Vagococcus sp.]|uniref:2-succinyl-6-hydroxy-2, 4-cyclohexadiene-1-carboxylate synthase n=1 Tax=uncultured Vagococcus sp. TaxID=189676 RepID=UPI0028D74233|nr:2-succinyl-6-hydroxy-2,4-cyclohexadiene-1-carboxylate synthase [uncultured Vagococcus sp.]